MHGFLSFCEWFFDNISPNGKYFISPLHINGSAIESIYSVLKFASGGNLSALSYGPALGKLINRKDLERNKNSEKGYRDVVVNISGTTAAADVTGSTTNLVVVGLRKSNFHGVFIFPSNVSQSTVGDRVGSNACTLIAVKCGAYCFQNKLDLLLLWNQLPNVWLNSFVNAICDGNEVYDELYGDTAVYLDVDVVNAVGDLFSVESADQLFGFTNANEFQDLVGHISGVIHSSSADHYGVIISCNMTVGIFVKSNGLCAIIDSHQHVNSNGGAMIIMASNPKEAILEYADCVMRNQNHTLNNRTLTWVQYT